jgi:hypothetical protein
LTDPAYVAQAGPIAPLDILYGLRPALASGNVYMAHRCGFTLKALLGVLQEAGFQKTLGRRRPKQFDLWAVASVSEQDDAVMRTRAHDFFP